MKHYATLCNTVQGVFSSRSPLRAHLGHIRIVILTENADDVKAPS